MQSFNETLRFIKRAKRNVLLNAKKPIPRGRPRLLSVLSLIHFRPLHHPDQANRARSPPSRTHTNSAVAVLKPPIAQRTALSPCPSPSCSAVAISVYITQRGHLHLGEDFPECDLSVNFSGLSVNLDLVLFIILLVFYLEGHTASTFYGQILK
ncbi:uncharacterized protein LOC121246468 [Juglans microcarpa x Juglans regia]|uniref:uncharacterized protein LOC121246468 n=1 Tax=Juglans microcarpa x Juglans regia TaxID=2249226 RepID=UPI001B7F2799|nr:uncharacterized protein LOC121246468 [Juglans microcarpa x Juglans regia]